MRQIFISYRHNDSQAFSDRLYERLATTFGNPTLFRDLDNLSGGEVFPLRLAKAVERSAVMLVIIGPAWLTLTDETGQRRLFAPVDYVRGEIETAILARIPIIPIIIQGATMPTAAALPTSIAGLADCQARRLRADPDFHQDFEAIIADLQKFVPIRGGCNILLGRSVNRLRRAFNALVGFAFLLLIGNSVLNALHRGISLPAITDFIHRLLTR